VDRRIIYSTGECVHVFSSTFIDLFSSTDNGGAIRID
jgi:hypothetical protein